jgi:hypothetical protein
MLQRELLMVAAKDAMKIKPKKGRTVYSSELHLK